MKRTTIFCLLASTGLVFPNQSAMPDRIQLDLQRAGAQLELRWPAQLRSADGTLSYPSFQLQSSDDLRQWTSQSVKQRGSDTQPILTANLDVTRQHAFYRVVASFDRVSKNALASGGAEVFGYADAFNQALAQIGQITPQEFSTRFSAATPYLSGLDWDPTTADYWQQFNADPMVYNIGLIDGIDDLRQFDFRLNAEELALFKKNGFVVSERLGAASCGELFNRIWKDDLPVFVGTDPILQAWHRSYDMMLSELEETFLFENLRQMLDGMAAMLPAAASEAGEGVLNPSVLDADYLLTVARSLLAGTNLPPALGQDLLVSNTLASIQAEELQECFEVFDAPRAVDFSQFKVRGHYTDSEKLGRYFKCVMWLGRMDLRVAGGPFRDSPCAEAHLASPRELGTAIVLSQLLDRSGQFERWRQFENLISTFVGWTDSLTFGQLQGILAGAGVKSLSDVPNLQTLVALQARLEQGQLGVQNINSDFFISPLGPQQARLPQSFTLFGQKFILDSWALGQTVFDRILWVSDGVTNKIARRVPSALDMAFSVLGNDQIVPELLSRITKGDARSSNDHMIQFRDGYSYQHNLAAVRNVIDQQPSSAWEQNLYQAWLGSLRELSHPIAADLRLPAAMRTRAWAMKDLNTQLASWTQLRHDTILYAKQSYTFGDGCSYPKGFVEPRPSFWKRMQSMALIAAKLIQASDFRGDIPIPTISGEEVRTNLTVIQQRQLAYLNHFADVTGTLWSLSEKELHQEPFTKAENDFISTTLVGERGYAAYWSISDGWYPKLFYKSLAREPLAGSISFRNVEGSFQQAYGATRWDGLVADVHTDVPCPNCAMPDPGSVLHEAVGRAFLLMVAVDNGPDRCIYAGPVLSHYEFELVGPPERLSDVDWIARLAKAGFSDFPWQDNDPNLQRDWSGVPPNPEWTRTYLAPRAR